MLPAADGRPRFTLKLKVGSASSCSASASAGAVSTLGADYASCFDRSTTSPSEDGVDLIAARQSCNQTNQDVMASIQGVADMLARAEQLAARAPVLSGRKRHAADFACGGSDSGSSSRDDWDDEGDNNDHAPHVTRSGRAVRSVRRAGDDDDSPTAPKQRRPKPPPKPLQAKPPVAPSPEAAQRRHRRHVSAEGYDSDDNPVVRRGEDARVIHLFEVPWLYKQKPRKSATVSTGGTQHVALGSNSSRGGTLPMSLSEGAMVQCPCCVEAREKSMRQLRLTLPRSAEALAGGWLAASTIGGGVALVSRLRSAWGDDAAEAGLTAAARSGSEALAGAAASDAAVLRFLADNLFDRRATVRFVDEDDGRGRACERRAATAVVLVCAQAEVDPLLRERARRALQTQTQPVQPKQHQQQLRAGKKSRRISARQRVAESIGGNPVVNDVAAAAAAAAALSPEEPPSTSASATAVENDGASGSAASDSSFSDSEDEFVGAMHKTRTAKRRKVRHGSGNDSGSEAAAYASGLEVHADAGGSNKGSSAESTAPPSIDCDGSSAASAAASIPAASHDAGCLVEAPGADVIEAISSVSVAVVGAAAVENASSAVIEAAPFSILPVAIVQDQPEAAAAAEPTIAWSGEAPASSAEDAAVVPVGEPAIGGGALFSPSSAPRRSQSSPDVAASAAAVLTAAETRPQGLGSAKSLPSGSGASTVATTAGSSSSSSSGPRTKVVFVDVSAVLPMADPLEAPAELDDDAAAAAAAIGGSGTVEPLLLPPPSSSPPAASSVSGAKGNVPAAAPAAAARSARPQRAAAASASLALRKSASTSSDGGGSSSTRSGGGMTDGAAALLLPGGGKGGHHASGPFPADEAVAHLLRVDYSAPVEVRDEPERGRCVYAAGFLPRGAFVAEYAGQLVTGEQAAAREAAYRAGAFGSYMFYFEHGGRQHCVDATAERKEYGLGRLISHSRRGPNLVPRKVVVDGVPRLALMAKRDVTFGEELAYDYGERDKAVLEAFAWLQKS